MSEAPAISSPPNAAVTSHERSTNALARRLARLSFQTNFEEERFFLILSIFIGVFSGLAVVCFRVAIDWSRIALMGALPHPHALRIIGAPTAVGLLVAVLVVHVFPQVRGSGVNQTKAALYVYNGYIPFKNAVGKFLCSALAIGSGQSLGPEDPSLQIGASLASAVLFVIEEVIGRWSAGILGSVVLSAISSVVVMRWFLGADAIFRVPVTAFVHPAELLAYAVLGLVGALAAVIFAN